MLIGLIVLLIIYSILIIWTGIKFFVPQKEADPPPTKEFPSSITATDIVEYSGHIMVIFFKNNLAAQGDIGIILAIHKFLEQNNIETSDEFDFNEACSNLKEHLKLETVSKGATK